MAIPRIIDRMSLRPIRGLLAAYAFRIRKGIFFTPNPAFKGKRCELVAADYAYSILRFFDDPIVGGYEPQQIALRRAISLAYDMPQEIRILRKG